MSGPMGKGRVAIGVVLITLVAIAIGYVIASAVLTFKDFGFRAEIEFDLMRWMPPPDGIECARVVL